MDEKTSEKTKITQHNYYMSHKEEIYLMQYKMKMCEICCREYRTFAYSRHCKTKKHKMNASKLNTIDPDLNE